MSSVYWVSMCKSVSAVRGCLRGDVTRRGVHSCQVRVLYATLGFFFCKVPGRGLRFFGLILKDMVAC